MGVDPLTASILFALGSALPTAVAAVAMLVRSRRSAQDDDGDDRLRRLAALDPEALDTFSDEVKVLAQRLREQGHSA